MFGGEKELYDSPAKSAGMIQRASMTERLERRKHELQTELARVTEILALLQKHPETQQVLDALSKMNFGF